MAEVIELILEKLTLLSFQLEIGISQSNKHSLEVLTCMFEGCFKGNNVIQIHYAFAPYYVGQYYSISLANVAGALQRLNGITFHSNRPMWVENAVLGRSSGSMATCQYPLAKSIELKNWQPFKASKHSSICGSG